MASMGDELRIRLLGELELSAGGEVIPLPSSKKTRALLGYLVVTRGEHTRSRLCDLLWEGPADPRAALRWSLSKLRPLVDGERLRIRADRERVSFEARGVAVDLLELRGALAGGTGDLDVDQLEACCRMFRGELLEGLEMEDCFGYAHWLAGEREKARSLHTQLLARLTTRLVDAPERGLEHARAWVALEPLDECAHSRLIETLTRLGRREEAQRGADACVRLFRRELGRAPGEVVTAALRSAPGRSGASQPVPAPPRPVELLPARDLGLFGRAEECSALERFLDGCQDHEGRSAEPQRLLWLSGEAGIGKSRLLSELVERARKRGAATFYGKAFEAEAARPFAIWSEVLGGGLDHEEPAGRAMLFERVRARLRAGDTGAGTVIALDDLQWIDESSAALVSWLAREGGPGLLLAAAVRPGEVEDRPSAQRLGRALAREDRLQPLELEPLDEPESVALMRSINPDTDARRLFQLSGGNPLFAIEMARAGDSGRSPRLRACISERLDRLGDAERELVRAGAAMGRRFSLEIAAVVTGLRPGELLRAAESLEVAGVVRPEGQDEYDFAHDLMRHAAYAELSDPVRRLLHRRIARALSEDPRADAELAPDLARQASLAGEHALAARACVHAGERCLRLFAVEEATSFASRGLTHAPMLDPAEQRRLSAELLAIEVHAGLGRRNREALHAQLTHLAEAATANGEHGPARNALYLLSVLDEESGEFVRAEERTLQAVAVGREADPATQAAALANTGRCLAQLERELPRAELFLREAEGREVPGAASADLAWGLGLLAWHRGDLGEAREQLERALATAREGGNHWAAFECLSRLALVDVAGGQPGRALEREEELRIGAKRLEGGSEGPLAEALMALASYALDPCTEAHGALERALTQLRAQDSKAVLAAVLNQAAELDLRRGEAERARARAREALDAARLVGRERQLARAQGMLDALERPPDTDPKEE